jgi:hypothetical protein
VNGFKICTYKKIRKFKQEELHEWICSGRNGEKINKKFVGKPKRENKTRIA